MSIPAITIVFDDNSPTIYTEAFARMQSLGLKGSNTLIANNINGVGLLTRTQLQAMYDGGWDIVNHSKQHQDLDTLSDADVITQVDDARTILLSEGWTRGAQEFVAPFNHISERVLNIVKSYARSACASAYFSSLDRMNYKPTDVWRIRRFGAATFQPDVIIEALDRAIAKGQNIHLYFHSIEEPIGYAYPPEYFQQVIEYIAAKKNQGRLLVLTMSEFTDFILSQQSNVRHKVLDRSRVRDMGTNLRFAAAGDRVDIPTNAAIDSITTEATLSMYVKRNSSQIAAHEYLLSAVSGGWHWRFDSLTSGALRFYWDGSNSILNGPVIPPGKWVHLAVTLSYDGVNTTAKFYLNGVLYNTRTAAGAISVSGKSLKIGVNGSNNFTFSGLIDEFKMYNTAFSAPDIAHLCANGSLPGAVASYLFDEATGSIVLDSSGNGNNGTTTGATYTTDTPKRLRTPV